MSNYFAAVFGAGISGTAIANELNKKGRQVLLIDPYVSEEAPGAPAGLVNPATGKRAKLSWNAKACMDALKDRVEELIQFSGRDDLIAESGVIRPALDEELAENFKDALDKYDWPEGWVKWMDAEEIKEMNPEIAPNYGGLYMDGGFTVYVDHYLNTYRKYLRKQGVHCRYQHATYHPENGNSTFKIEFEDGEQLHADHVIIAAGHQTPLFKDWEYLPLHRVKGQIIWYESEKALDWEHGISAMGYSLRRGRNELVVGSTYEHPFDDLDTTEEARKKIHAKLKKMLPGLPDKLTIKMQLAGVRVSTPNRLPVIGRHPKQENLCIYTGMGSKGLLFSHYCARQLAEHLAEGKAIHPKLSTGRFKYKKA